MNDVQGAMPSSLCMLAAKRLNGLDHLRALAIISVFLTHYGSLFPHPAWVERMGQFGWTGVDLFFVLSGYLIGGQLLREVASHNTALFGEFYLKRFFRIIPAYLVVVGLYFLVADFREAAHIPPLWKFLTFTQNLGLSFESGRAFSHAWSLCVEEHFYLVLPLLLVSVARRPRRTSVLVAAAVVLGGLAIRGFSWAALAKPISYPSWFEWIYYPSYTRLDGLLVGVCVAATQIFAPAIWGRIARQCNWLAFAGLALLVGAYFLCEDRITLVSSLFSFPLIAAGYGCLLIAAVSPTSVLNRTRFALTWLVATWSYSLYLTHKGVIHLSQELFAHLGMEPAGNVTFVLTVGTSLLAAGALYTVVERPFMRLRDAALSRRRRVNPSRVNPKSMRMVEP
jgi:peptidoglycan/LPS O-acetylase OafA/YrhL